MPPIVFRVCTSCWRIAPRFDFTLDTVPMRPGERWVRDEDMIARWGDDVGVALLTFVTSTASHRSDIAGLVAHGHRMGSIVGVDITQGIGVAPFSVRDTDADFVVSTSLKWLCGTSGAGILQVTPALLATCGPESAWLVQPAEPVFVGSRQFLLCRQCQAF